MGFDNAHAVKAKKHGHYAGTIVSYDHVHHSINDKGVPYQFENAQQLLNDFLSEVNAILSKELAGITHRQPGNLGRTLKTMERYGIIELQKVGKNSRPIAKALGFNIEYNALNLQA